MALFHKKLSYTVHPRVSTVHPQIPMVPPVIQAEVGMDSTIS